MAEKIKTIFECQNCGAQFPKWSGRCLECGKWGSLISDIKDDKKINQKNIIKNIVSADIINLSQAKNNNVVRLPSGVSEIDRVLGGGLISGSIILLSGEPGVGKSILLV